MAISITHTTPADGSFSATGETAWEEEHTQSGFGALAELNTVGTTQIDDAAVTLAKMANLAQNQFIGRTTASTGVPETATITPAALTVLDDATVDDMRQTLLANRFAPGGRLYFSANTPISSTDLTAQTTLRYGPPVGSFGWPGGNDEIELWDGTRWVRKTFSEITLAVASSICTLYNVYVFLDSGTVTLEAEAWTGPLTGPIASSTDATPIVVTDVAHGLTANDLIVSIGHTTNTNVNNPYRVTVPTADTIGLLLSAGNSAGAGGTTGNWYRINQTQAALAVNDGRLTKSGDKTRLFVGVYMTWTTSGQSEDSLQRRLLWNAYGQVNQKLFNSVAVSATDAVAAQQYHYASGATPNAIVVCGGQSVFGGSASFNASGTDEESARGVPCVDGASVTSSPGTYDLNVFSTNPMRVVTLGSNQVAAGCHFFTFTSHRNAGSNNVTYGTQQIGIPIWPC